MEACISVYRPQDDKPQQRGSGDGDADAQAEAAAERADAWWVPGHRVIVRV